MTDAPIALLREPRVGLGTSTFGRNLDPEESRALVWSACDLGVATFDTANVYGGRYGSSESLLGAALKGHARDSFSVMTKVGFRVDSRWSNSRFTHLSTRSVETEVRASLRRLNLDHLDVVQLHAPNPNQELDDALHALFHVQGLGLTRHIGVCRLDHDEMATAQRCAAESQSSIETHQIETSLLRHGHLRSSSTQRDGSKPRTIGFGILGGGLLTARYLVSSSSPRGRMDEPLYSAVRDRVPRDLIVELAAFAAEAGVSLARVAFGWAFSRRELDLLLVGASTQSQLEELLRRPTWYPTAADSARLQHIIEKYGSYSTLPYGQSDLPRGQ